MTLMVPHTSTKVVNMTSEKKEVNQHLKDMCKIASIDYIDNSSFNP